MTKLVHIHKKLCDVCGAEIPNITVVAAMSHNKAANSRWGKWVFQSGVISIEHDDLCQDCGLKVTAFINRLKEEVKPKSAGTEVELTKEQLFDMLEVLWERKDPVLHSWVRQNVDKIGT